MITKVVEQLLGKERWKRSVKPACYINKLPRQEGEISRNRCWPLNSFVGDTLRKLFYFLETRIEKNHL